MPRVPAHGDHMSSEVPKQQPPGGDGSASVQTPIHQRPPIVSKRWAQPDYSVGTDRGLVSSTLAHSGTGLKRECGAG